MGHDAAQEGDRSLARIQVPHAVRVAFDEVLDLFRCVEGTEASVTSFVEALVAEGIGPDLPADVDANPMARTRGRALVEDLLARSTNHWEHLPTRSSHRTEADRATTDLLSFEALYRCAGEGDAAALDRQMRHLLRLEDTLSVRLGRLLVEMGDRGAWARLRFAGPGHYAEERLRIGRSRAEDRVRAARSLRRFPALRDAYERGLIGLQATLQIVRLLGESVTDRATEEAWVRHAVAATIKRIRDESRALGRGLVLNRRLSDPHPPGHEGESTGASAIGNRSPSRPLSDSDWQSSLHRTIGTARERVRQLGLLATGASPNAIPPTDIASIALPLSPDVFLRLRLPSELCASFLATIETARRRLTREVDTDPWAERVPGAVARPSWIAARTFSIRARRIPSWVGLLALLEEFADLWDRQNRPASPARDAIYIREGWRCAAPGCTSRRNLEDHHVVYRSRGGSDALSNRICLCRFHHQLGEHGELAACSGSAPLAMTWRLGRAGIGGRYRNELRLEVAA
jgi:5-methylcytosine-specific restriction endonuclease McrA